MAAGHLNKCHLTLAALTFSHIFKQERDAVNCCTVAFIGVPIAGQHHAELSGSLRQSAGWPKSQQGAFRPGLMLHSAPALWQAEQEAGRHRQLATNQSHTHTVFKSSYLLLFLRKIFSIHHWSLATSWSVFLLNSCISSTLCLAPPQHCLTPTPFFTSSPLPEMQEVGRNFGPPQAGEVRDVTPHKRSLTPSVDGLLSVLK